MSEAAEFIADIMIAISNCTLYRKEHPAVLQLCERAYCRLDALYAEDTFSIALLDDCVHVNGQPFSERSLHVKNFVKRLRRKEIEKIIISGVLQPMNWWILSPKSHFPAGSPGPIPTLPGA